MNMQETQLKDSFEKLIESYSIESSCAFLANLSLIKNESFFERKEFARHILTDGDSHEVYTSEELKFINTFENELGIYKTKLSSINGPVNCRYIVIGLEGSHYSLCDCIRLMKIYNKAFDSYNVFLITLSESVYIGCSYNDKNPARNCRISYPITADINWTLLMESAFFHLNDNNLYSFYKGIVGFVDNIAECYVTSREIYNDWISSPYVFCGDFLDDYYIEDPDIKIKAVFRCTLEQLDDIDEDDESIIPFSRFSLENCIDYGYLSYDDQYKRKEYTEEVSSYMDELSYIKSLRVNSLEMVLEAEELLNQAQKSSNESGYSTATDDSDFNELSEHIRLLDDPISLLEKLKKDRGLK